MPRRFLVFISARGTAGFSAPVISAPSSSVGWIFLICAASFGVSSDTVGQNNIVTLTTSKRDTNSSFEFFIFGLCRLWSLFFPCSCLCLVRLNILKVRGSIFLSDTFTLQGAARQLDSFLYCIIKLWREQCEAWPQSGGPFPTKSTVHLVQAGMFFDGWRWR